MITAMSYILLGAAVLGGYTFIGAFTFRLAQRIWGESELSYMEPIFIFWPLTFPVCIAIIFGLWVGGIATKTADRITTKRPKLDDEVDAAIREAEEIAGRY